MTAEAREKAIDLLAGFPHDRCTSSPPKGVPRRSEGPPLLGYGGRPMRWPGS
jgi:hypothetical protein